MPSGLIHSEVELLERRVQYCIVAREKESTIEKAYIYTYFVLFVFMGYRPLTDEWRLGRERKGSYGA